MSEILMSKTKTETVVRNRIEPKLNIQEPPQYRVIYINDEQTTQEFLAVAAKHPHFRRSLDHASTRRRISSGGSITI